MDDLQHRYDALERKLAALEHTASKQETGSHAEGGALGGISQTHGGGPSRAYRASDYVCEATQYDFEALLLEKDVKLFDLALERDQALAQAARFKQRLESLFQGDNFAADARCQSTESDGTMKPAAASGNKTGFGAFLVASGKKRQGAGRKHPTLREQELLDTIELLKNALERTKKGLESGVSNSKYMQVCILCRYLVGTTSVFWELLKEIFLTPNTSLSIGNIHNTRWKIQGHIHCLLRPPAGSRQDQTTEIQDLLTRVTAL